MHQSNQFFIEKAQSYIRDFERFKNEGERSGYSKPNDIRLKVKLMISEFDNSDLFLNAFEQADTSKTLQGLPAKVDRYIELLKLFINHIEEFRIGRST